MRYLRRKDENFLYGWSESLAKRTEFFECDKAGKAVESTPVEDEPVPAAAEPLKPERAFQKTIADMNDLELEKYARDMFDVELDRRRSMDTLRAQVRGLTNGTLSPEDVANGLSEPPAPEGEEPTEDPFATPAVDLPEMPEAFATKADAIRWAKAQNLGISFRARDTKGKTIERIEKRLEELRNDA